MTLRALIQKMKEAGEGSRDLDGEIAASAAGFTRCDIPECEDNGKVHNPPPYTSSIDSAISLVPEGWRVENLAEWEDARLRASGPWMATLSENGKRGIGLEMGPRCDHAPSAALALCIAALEARQKMKEAM